MTATMLDGFWESTFAPDPVTGKPFAVDAIISNPPAFGHVHIAEALGVPLMLSFSKHDHIRWLMSTDISAMPWTPSTSFKHPLVNIKETNAEKSMTNWLSYDMANLLQWQGLGDIINAFRSVTLGLEPLTQRSGPYIVDRLRIPYTYCWSDGLIQKPPDWGSHVG
jgi:sterol 3beta-glucosyltransferase